MTRFSFRAGAAALGGWFTRPFTQPLPVQAATFLPPVGGYGSSRVEHYRFHEIVSFKAGYSQVIGTEHAPDGKPVRETLVSAVVEGLNILDVVTADRVVGRLVSESPASDDPGDELRMLPIGSYFQNLRIAGQPVNVTPHRHLLDERAARRSDLERASEGQLFDPEGPEDAKPLAVPCKGLLRCSLFRPLEQSIAGARTSPGCRITVPGFGDIFLGEYLVGADRRQLTMIRVELHSPEKGRLVVSAVEGNGSPY
jgi:hypothetical protein